MYCNYWCHWFGRALNSTSDVYLYWRWNPKWIPNHFLCRDPEKFQERSFWAAYDLCNRIKSMPIEWAFAMKSPNWRQLSLPFEIFLCQILGSSAMNLKTKCQHSLHFEPQGNVHSVFQCRWVYTEYWSIWSNQFEKKEEKIAWARRKISSRRTMQYF